MQQSWVLILLGQVESGVLLLLRRKAPPATHSHVQQRARLRPAGNVHVFLEVSIPQGLGDELTAEGLTGCTAGVRFSSADRTTLHTSYVKTS